MKMISRKKWSYILILCILVILFMYPFFPVLALEKENTGDLIAFISLDKAQSFQIHYIHSIHKTPVLESFYIRGESIVLDQLEYYEFAVGMPSEAEGDAIYEQKDGKMMLRHINRSLPHIDLRIAQVTPDHQLIVEEIPLLFETIAEPGSWIRLKVRYISVWDKLKGVDFIEHASG